MFTDMVGYSRLAERDEAAALELLETQRQLLCPLFPKHQGREVKSTDWSISGEGVLADEAIGAIESFFTASASRNMQIILYNSVGVPRVTKTGRGHLSTKDWSANRGEKVTMTVEIVADGALATVVA